MVESQGKIQENKFCRVVGTMLHARIVFKFGTMPVFYGQTGEQMIGQDL